MQKRALRVFLGNTLLPFEECLVLTGLKTLETRRYELLMGFGHNLLSSQKHRDILPPNITHPAQQQATAIQPYNPYSHTAIQPRSNTAIQEIFLTIFHHSF